MNKFVKASLIGYGALIAVNVTKVLVSNIRLGKQDLETVHGYSVMRDTGVMKANYMRVASAMVFTDGSKRIVVDEFFFTLPAHAQRAILAHEEAHIVLGHLDNITKMNQAKRAMSSIKGGVQDIELEADAYAADKVGTEVMISALTSLLTIKGVNKKEIRSRINALQTK